LRAHWRAEKKIKTKGKKKKGIIKIKKKWKTKSRCGFLGKFNVIKIAAFQILFK
jgi:hypothetical protein